MLYRRSSQMLLFAFVASIAIHIVLGVLVQRAIAAREREFAESHAVTTQVVLLPPQEEPAPPEPEPDPKPEPEPEPAPKPKPEPPPPPPPPPADEKEVALGVDAPNPISEIWLGFKDFLEQKAAPGSVDQAAFTDKPVLASPTPPSPEEVSDTPPAPKDAPEDAQPAADQPPSDTSADTPPDESPPAPPAIDETPVSIEPPPSPPVEPIATPPGEPAQPPLDLRQLIDALRLPVLDAPAAADHHDDVRDPPAEPVPPAPGPTEPAPPKPAADATATEADQPAKDGSTAPAAPDGILEPKITPPAVRAAEEPVPQPPPAEPDAAKPEASTQPVASTRPADAPASQPALVAAVTPPPAAKPRPKQPGAQKPHANDAVIRQASNGEIRIGAQADKESDATSVITVPRENWRLGKPLAGHGIELKPRRPELTDLMRLTSNPGNPLCQIKFGKDGVPTDARITESTGDSRIDEAILSSLFRWRAAGEELAKIPDGRTVQVTMRIILNGRGG